MSAIFSWAVKRGDRRQPTLQAGRPQRDPEPRARPGRFSEVPRFWTAFDDAGLVVGTALKMILLTGQRPGEVAHMRREHIVDGWWEMPGEPVPALGWPGTKNGAGHRVWLPAVQALLAELGDAATRLRVRRSAWPSGRAASMRRCARSAPSSASSGRRRTICGGLTHAPSPGWASAATP